MGLEYMPPQKDPPGTTPGRFSAVLWQSHVPWVASVPPPVRLGVGEV